MCSLIKRLLSNIPHGDLLKTTHTLVFCQICYDNFNGYFVSVYTGFLNNKLILDYVSLSDLKCYNQSHMCTKELYKKAFCIT